MFKFFKRNVPATKQAEVKRPAAKRASAASQDFDPAPLPEVTEGDGEADWTLWEHSVNSQLQPLSGFQSTDHGDISAFDSVGKRDR